jgi:poly(hydroxyalkanoate) depolymerase family esterase
MLARILGWLARLRTWLLVRLGLWRGTWRRGQVSVPAAALFAGPLANRRWSYGLYCPRSLPEAEPAPLVLLLHGCKQRALGFAQASGFTRIADAQRLRLLCPEQRRRANPWRCWNWFAPAAQRGGGELDVMRAMLDDVAQQVAVAPGAVAAVGLSAGGGLAALLAFHAPDRVDAAVAVAAPPLLGRGYLQDPRDVLKRGLAIEPALALGSGRAIAPLMVVHGLADEVVAPVCAEQLTEQALRVNQRVTPLEAADSVPGPGLAQTDHRAGDRLRVRLLRIDALGHAWSGGGSGHPFVTADGAPLATLALQFLRDAGLLAPRAPAHSGAATADGQS